MTGERIILVLLAVVVIVLALMLFAPGGGPSVTAVDNGSSPHGPVGNSSRPSLSSGLLAEAPLTVVASSTSSDSRQTWLLSVNSARQAELSDSFEKSVIFQISQGDWDMFREALERERFFDLNSEYGDREPGGLSETLTVSAGPITHTVSLHYMLDYPESIAEEAARADRLARILIGWAHDGRHHDPFRRTLLDRLEVGGYQGALEYLATVDPEKQVQVDIEHGRAGLMGVFGATLFLPGMEDDLWLHDRPYWPIPGTSDAIESPAHSAWIGAAIEFAKAYNTELRKHRPDLFEPDS